MNKFLVALVAMAGLVSAQQQQPASTLDSVISAVEQAAKDTSASEVPKGAAAGTDGVGGEKDSKDSADKRSKVKTASIVSGAAALGAVIGASASKDNRAKGALIGAAVGGGVGYLIERMTRGNDDKPAGEQTDPGEKPAATASVGKPLLTTP